MSRIRRYLTPSRSTAASTAGCTLPQPIESARRGRPFLATSSFVECPQHRRQIPLQFDSQFALVWGQDDGLDEATKCLRGLRADFRMGQGLSQRGNFLPGQVGHSGMQQWRRFVRGLEQASSSSRRLAFARSSSSPRAPATRRRERGQSASSGEPRSWRSRFAEAMLAPCSMRKQFISFANSRQNSSTDPYVEVSPAALSVRALQLHRGGSSDSCRSVPDRERRSIRAGRSRS
jgi:hypothetical protein